jgi:hypothetical protein
VISSSDPPYNEITASASWDNNYEIVDFIPPVTGDYDAAIVEYPCYASPRAYAVAWLQIPGPAPAVAMQRTTTQLDAFVVGRDEHVWQSVYNGAWSGWAGNDRGAPPINPTFDRPISDPTAVWWQDDRRLDLFVISGDWKVYQRTYCAVVFAPDCSSTGWSSSWINLGGDVWGSAPSAAAWTTGDRLDVLAQSSLSTLLQRTWTTSGWSAWIDLGMPPGVFVDSAPSATWWRSNLRLDVFVRGSDNQLWQRFYCVVVGPHMCNSVGWQPWVPLGQTLHSAPSVAATQTGDRLEVFAQGPDRSLIHREWLEAGGGGWGGWQSDLAGEVFSAPAAVVSTDGTRRDVLAQLPTNELGQRTRFGAGAWGSWQATMTYK